MSYDALREILLGLCALYGFVATIWAICLPSIRETGQGKFWFVGILRVVIFCFGILFWAPNFVEFAGEKNTTPYTAPEVIIALAVFAPIIAAGLGMLFALEELSQSDSKK